MCPRMTSTSLIWHLDRGTARCLPNLALKHLLHLAGKTRQWQWLVSRSQLEGFDDILSAQPLGQLCATPFNARGSRRESHAIIIIPCMETI